MLLFLTMIEDEKDRQVFVQLFNEYNKKAYYGAYEVVKDCQLAEDIAQSVFMKIADDYDSFKSRDIHNIATYIFAAAKYAAVDYLRKHSKIEIISLYDIDCEQHPDPRALVEQYILNIEDKIKMLENLEKINPDYSYIIYLKYYIGHNYKEISEIMGISIEAVRVKMHRAIVALKREIEKEGYFNEKPVYIV